jgi:putative DNA primase/helicase
MKSHEMIQTKLSNQFENEICLLQTDIEELPICPTEFRTGIIEINNDYSTQRVIEVKQSTFDPAIEAQAFMKDKHIIFFNEQLKQYQGGCYKTLSNRYCLHQLTLQLKGYYSRQAKARETLDVLKNSFSDPKILDRINPNPYIINCKNGLIDVRNMELAPHTPDHISTFQINANYNENSKCPLFDKFLKEILIGQDRKPDFDLIKIIQEFMGYCLFPRIPFHKAVIFYGKGSSGKSKLVEILEHLINGHTSNVHFEIIGVDTFATADLSNSLLNISAEVSANGKFKDNIVKQIIAADTIRVQRKNQPAFDFKPFAKHIITANNLPLSADKSCAYFRRFIIIPFNQQFLSKIEIDQKPIVIRESIKVEDPDIIDKLKMELDGIFLFALRGLERLLKNKGFTKSEQVINMLKIFKIRSSSVESFISEATETSSDDQILFKDVLTHYIEYCNKHTIPSLSRAKFSQEVKDLGFLVEKGTDNKTFIKGISWN